MIEVGGSREQAWVVERATWRVRSEADWSMSSPRPCSSASARVRATTRRAHLATGQKTVGASISLDHLAATPPGMTVTVRATLVEVEGRRLTFEIEARDEVELVARARHVRYIIDAMRFEARVAQKGAQARTVGAAQTRTEGAAQARTTGAAQTDGVRGASADGAANGLSADGKREPRAEGAAQARTMGAAQRPWARRNQHGATIASSHAIHSRRAF